MHRFALLVLVVSATSVPAAPAADPTYWQDVRPILRKNCTVCHREAKLKEIDVSAGLALDSPEHIRSTGKKPSVVARKPDESLLVTLLTAKDVRRRMPLDADPLPAESVAILRKWVAAGMPEGTKPVETAENPTTTPTRPVRKLPVRFATKTTLTKLGALELTLLIGPLPPVAAVVFHPGGKWLAVGTYGRVTVWDLTTAKPAKVLTNVLGAVNDLKFSPKGDILAVAGGLPSARGDIRLFDTRDWKLVGTLGGHLDTVSCVSFSPDGTRLASASFDKTVRLWDVKNRKISHTFTGHSDFVYAVSFGPKGDFYATASKDRTGRIVDAATGQSRFTFSGMDQEVLAVAVRPDGAQVFTSGFEPQLHVWDVETGERLKKQGGHNTAVHEIAFDAKGTMAVTAGGDRQVRVWNAAEATQSKNILVDSVVFAVAADAAGKRIAGGCADGLVRLWDPAGKPLATLWAGPGKGELGHWLAITSEGYTSASESLLSKEAWRIGGKSLPDSGVLEVLSNPGLVAKSLAGEKIPEPVLRK